MSHLTFPLLSGELALPVVIGHSHNALVALSAAGQALPSPVWTRGVVDTGTTITCVTREVLQKLELSATGQGSSRQPMQLGRCSRAAT